MAENINYAVRPYSAAALAEALSNRWVDAAATREKNHFRYFCEYLGDADGLGARTILIEEPYFSQSFINDHADYYARGFVSYERYCKRVHFFSVDFSEDDLHVALTDPTSDFPWENYLGYIVVKPLPARQIGATLLLPYYPGNRRHYPVVRTYELNLLGKQLALDTLIFQEQDRNVSACATTALWMAFHKTAFLFQTPLPSPYQITAGVRHSFSPSGRAFPNDGLDQSQIGDAIQAVGLVAEMRTYRQQDEWGPEADIRQKMTKQLREAKGFLYAYLRMGLPVLLFLLMDENPDAGHLVTITGYRITPQQTPASPDISLLSDMIDRLYVHDDQMGPFARLSFTDDGLLLTPWPDGDDWDSRRVASFYNLFVPISAEIRITYEEVYPQVGRFEQIFTNTLEEDEDVVWDIYLERSNTYKAELRQSPPVDEGTLRDILTSHLPKYIWVARATIRRTPILEMVFDATDLHTGFYCMMINVFDPLRESLHDWLSRPNFREQLLAAQDFDARFMPLLLRSLRIAEDDSQVEPEVEIS